jgi:phospholipid/cholesterol/gamma-HCH transport system substrate-binding protein
MARSERSLRVKRRLQGVAFLAVVALLLGFTIAVYNKSLPWQSADKVTLMADRIGNQLVVPADVKLDGILVGRVSGVHVEGNQAVMTLQIDKSHIKQIPADVQARILPKTLFGEKFVSLVVPDGTPTGAPHIKVGGVIEQDHSKTAIELQTVFNDLVPLLRALKPAELSIALSNLADALRNRGNALGHNLVLVNTYFTQFNTDLPNFNKDISGLADAASNYADATPDLMRTLHNFTVNAKTMTVKKDQFAQFLIGTQGFAEEATKVFGDNANRLITLAQVSKPVLDLYASYSQVLECLPNGLAIYDRSRLEQTFGQGPFLHITLTPVGDRGAYTTADRPTFSELTNTKPPANNDNSCYGLPRGNINLHPVNPELFKFPGPHPNGNYKCAGYLNNPAYLTCPDGSGTPTTAPSSSTKKSGAKKAAATSHGAQTPEQQTAVKDSAVVDEENLLSGLFAPMVGDATDPGLEYLLVGPLMRGMKVGVSL